MNEQTQSGVGAVAAPRVGGAVNGRWRRAGRNSCGGVRSLFCSVGNRCCQDHCSHTSEQKNVSCVTKLPISSFPTSFLFIPIWVPFPTTLEGKPDRFLGKTRPPQGKTRPKKGKTRPPRRTQP